MSRIPHFLYHQPPELFSHQALDLTFRLLRNNEPELAFTIKQTLDKITFAPAEALANTYSDEMHLNGELLKLLGAESIVKIVAALNIIGQHAVNKKDLPPQHMKILSGLIEDWATLTEWILQHSTWERRAFH